MGLFRSSLLERVILGSMATNMPSPHVFTKSTYALLINVEFLSFLGYAPYRQPNTSYGRIHGQYRRPSRHLNLMGNFHEPLHQAMLFFLANTPFRCIYDWFYRYLWSDYLYKLKTNTVYCGRACFWQKSPQPTYFRFSMRRKCTLCQLALFAGSPTRHSS